MSFVGKEVGTERNYPNENRVMNCSKALKSKEGEIRSKMEGWEQEKGKRRGRGGGAHDEINHYQGRVLAAPKAKWRVHFSSPPQSTLHTTLTNVLR